MGKKAEGLIRAEKQDFYSKFKLESRFENHATNEIWIFNVNSDVALPKFWSLGANKTPVRRTLVGTYNDPSQFLGFDRFSGSIGDGRFYIRTDKGVIFKGSIDGGPTEGQSFTGAGTWLQGKEFACQTGAHRGGLSRIKGFITNCFQ